MTDRAAEIKGITDKCINCGFCEAVCPTLEASSFKAAIGARGRVMIAKEMLSELKHENFNGADFLDPFYSCLNCNACLTVCPAGINAGEISHLSREELMDKKTASKSVADMIVKLTVKYGSPLGLSKKMNKWFGGMKFYDDSEILFYTGQMYLLTAYSKKFSKLEMKMGERLTNVGASIITRFPFLIKLLSFFVKGDNVDDYRRSTRNIYDLLSKAGIRMNHVENEPYPGTFILELGDEEEFRRYAENFTKIIKEKRIKKIITTDPHTYDLLKFSYPKYVRDFDAEVSFYTDFLAGVKFRKLDEHLIIHEPCHLIRGQDKYNVASRILENVSRLTFPTHSGQNTACCGGPDELLFPNLSEMISEERYRELRSAGKGNIVTACPICLSNLNKNKDAKDLSDILERAMI